MKNLLSALSAVLTAALLSSGAAKAQVCFGPDSLDGDCCAITDVSLPNFPPLSMPSKGLCWDACLLDQETCVQVSFDPPHETNRCGLLSSDLQILACDGQVLMKGSALLSYTRTWSESGFAVAPPDNEAPHDLQVWRFVLRTDLATDALDPAQGCPVPNSLPDAGTAFFYGYVDYVRDCQTGQWAGATAMFHGCDWLMHRPGLSSKPGVFDPTTSYAIVGPHTAANPFVAGNFQVAFSPLLDEAMRSIPAPALSGMLAPCRTEERIAQGIYDPLAYACFCPLDPALNQAAVIRMQGQSQCQSSFQTLSVFGPTPWFHDVSHAIGGWTTDKSYPGQERVRVDEGLFLYRDACKVTPVNTGYSFDVFYGAETQGGYDRTSIGQPAGLPLSDRLVDLASNWSHPVGTPVTLPLLGEIFESDHLIYLDLD